MNCKNCKHWQTPYTEFWGADDIADSWIWNYDTNEYEKVSAEKQRELYGHEVRYCRSPKLKFYERPEKGGATVCDGSQYLAVMITSEYFGCVNFEAANLM